MEQGYTGYDAKAYDQIKRDRKKADALTWRMGVPRDLGSGLAHLGQAIAIRRLNNRADNAVSGLVDALGADHPMVMGLMDMPKYALGTDYHPGGKAVVGEHGPEIVDLPKGAKVQPNARTYNMIAQLLGGQQQPVDIPPGGPMTINGMPPQIPVEQYDPASQQRLQENPEEMQAPPIDTRELLQPQSRFDDANAYQTAELDAFKLMQQQPEYSPADDGQKLTGDQAKTLAYLRRAMFADAAMSDPRLAKAMTRMDNSVAGNLGALGRLYTDDDFELAKLMAEQFSSAILRRDSGAATPDPEVARYNRQYFPLPNETDEQLAAKAALRREEIRALQMSLGNASHLGQQIEQEIADLVAASQKEDETPEISAEEKEYLKSLGIQGIN